MGWTTGRTAPLKRRPTKKERKTKQKQGSKENKETRRGEKERQSLSLLPGKAAQGGRESPAKPLINSPNKALLSKQCWKHQRAWLDKFLKLNTSLVAICCRHNWAVDHHWLGGVCWQPETYFRRESFGG